VIQSVARGSTAVSECPSTSSGSGPPWDEHYPTAPSLWDHPATILEIDHNARLVNKLEALDRSPTVDQTSTQRKAGSRSAPSRRDHPPSPAPPNSAHTLSADLAQFQIWAESLPNRCYALVLFIKLRVFLMRLPSVWMALR
jgi:hypothetical protein